MPSKQLLSAGAQSASWVITEIDSPIAAFGPDDWAQLPEGRLKSVLSATYPASPPEDTAMFSALAEAGFRSSTIGTPFVGSGGATDVAFSVGGETTGQVRAVLFLSPSYPDGSMVLTLSVTYSVEA